MKAIWNDTVIANSDSTVVIENNHYFPRQSVNMEYLEKSGSTYTCPWKGEAYYYNIKISDRVNRDAAWTYPEPKKAAENIAGRIAFWKGVEVTE